MADKYERWNDWAPQYISDLCHDFDLEPWQAAAFPGNFAAESGYFNSIQEWKPLVAGSKGGYGHAQWTGPRRRAFEAWLKRKGLTGDTYAGNYSYLYRELSGAQAGFDYRKVLKMVKDSKTLDSATYIVGKYFEGPAVLNMAPRLKAAKEALALWEKMQPKPSEKKEIVMPTASVNTGVTSTPGVVIPPAIPWWKSVVTTGSSAGLGASVWAVLQVYKPGVPFLNQLDTLAPPVVAALGTLFALISRVSSQSQPVTLTQGKADAIAQERGLPNEAQGDANVAAGASLYGPATAQPMVGTQVPLDHLPLNQLANELPRVIETLGLFIPALGVLGKVLEGVQNAQGKKP